MSASNTSFEVIISMKKVRVKIKGKNSPKVERVISAWRKNSRQNTDVLGSYTGSPSKSADAKPEQDSDDL